MSSQLLSAKHFNTVESNLLELVRINKIYADSVEINKTMQVIRSLSIRSYFEQYKHHYKDNYLENILTADKDLNKITKVKILPSIMVYNAMRSILYQIEVYEQDLTLKEKKYLDIFNGYLLAIANSIIQEKITDKQSSLSWSID